MVGVDLHLSTTHVLGIVTADCGLRTADCGLRTADCGLRTADCGLRTADCGLRTADCRLRNNGIKHRLRYKTQTKHYGLSIKRARTRV